MSYSLPFKEGQRLLEIGGGSNPRLRPNLDVRPGPTVDYVADLNKPLPLASESFDGVLEVFVLEHLSWRVVSNHLGEVHRILAQGGVFVCVTANTWEQIKTILARGYWADTDASTLYGDQNYDGDDWRYNAHYAGWSPEYLMGLFRKAGFCQADWRPLEGAPTDMIIEAHKSAAQITIGALV